MRDSFKYALRGIRAAYASERNLKIHAIIAGIVALMGFYFNVSTWSWIILLILIGLVIAAEMTNTAIEKIMDLLHPEKAENVRIIKDISAGMVLVLSIMAAIVGILIFYPYWNNLINIGM